MPVMIIPKEDGTNLRARVEAISCRKLFDIDDIKNVLDMSIPEAFKLATAHTDLRGVRYRVLKSTPAYHSLTSEIVRILIKNTIKQSSTVEITATVTCTQRNEYHSDAKRGYYVYADFEYNGTRYTDVLIGESDRYPPKVGEQVVVCVEKDNPTNAIEKNNMGHPIPLIIIGAIGILYAFHLKKKEN